MYLTNTKTDRIDCNYKGNNVFVFALAFPSLNRLRTHNERIRFLCLSMLVWAAYTLLVAITKITCVHCMRTSRAVVIQTRELLNNTRVELQNTLPTRVLKV